MKIERTLEARKERYQEYLNLKSLPFFNEEQFKRLQWLKKQRRIDNQFALKEGSKDIYVGYGE